MSTIEIDSASVAQLMDRWPALVRVFLAARLHCIGCPIAPFHTLEEAAGEHGLLLADLRAAVLAGVVNAPPGVYLLSSRLS